jgi:hypothetical protein
VTFVEWPEAGAAELPPADVDVLLTHRTPESRGLELRAAPGLERALAGEMTAAGIEQVRRREQGGPGEQDGLGGQSSFARLRDAADGATA